MNDSAHNRNGLARRYIKAVENGEEDCREDISFVLGALLVGQAQQPRDLSGNGVVVGTIPWGRVLHAFKDNFLILETIQSTTRVTSAVLIDHGTLCDRRRLYGKQPEKEGGEAKLGL